MNKDRVLALADTIEKMDRFDYAVFFNDEASETSTGGHYLSSCANALVHKCGTVGCVAGWAVAEAFVHGVDVDAPKYNLDEVRVMADWLGIDYNEADQIAYGGLFQYGEINPQNPMDTMTGVTAGQVATALREWVAGERELWDGWTPSHEHAR